MPGTFNRRRLWVVSDRHADTPSEAATSLVLDPIRAHRCGAVRLAAVLLTFVTLLGDGPAIGAVAPPEAGVRRAPDDAVRVLRADAVVPLASPRAGAPRQRAEQEETRGLGDAQSHEITVAASHARRVGG